MTDRTLEDRLRDDLKTAMKQGDTTTRDTIRFTMSSLKNARIEKGESLDESDEITVLQRDAKRRQESIDQFRAGGRADLVAKEEAELAVVQRYLPTPLSDSEIDDLVRQAIAQTNASQPKDLGKVMPVLIQLAAGRADGKRLSNAAKNALTGN